jgi:hypothetical protein
VASGGTLHIPVSATQGTGPAITGVQLQLLGLVLSTGASGSQITVNASQIAYGANSITPVANLSNGKQVFGAPITVTRQFNQVTGRAETPLAYQNPGFDICYYPGAAGNTLATTSFSGKPANVVHCTTAQIAATTAPGIPINVPVAYRNGANKGLAIQIKSAFTVTQAGEYSFISMAPWPVLYTSGAVLVDGVAASSFDLWNGSTFVTTLGDGSQLDETRSIYLLPGEHTLTVQLVQAQGVSDASMNYSLYFRGLANTGSAVDEAWGIASTAQFYTVRGREGQ